MVDPPFQVIFTCQIAQFMLVQMFAEVNTIFLLQLLTFVAKQINCHQGFKAVICLIFPAFEKTSLIIIVKFVFPNHRNETISVQRWIVVIAK